MYAAELHVAGEIAVLDEVAVKYSPTDGSLEACLRVIGGCPDGLPPGGVLFPAECGERVH
ncbi:hypothetical protein [Streptomyces sp. NPDC057877]|uniref:hypothetical protein n=1 Tax=Streptomyces sp. NPDC057877 TaxID=3346269 RepID=UPI00369F633D